MVQHDGERKCGQRGSSQPASPRRRVHGAGEGGVRGGHRGQRGRHRGAAPRGAPRAQPQALTAPHQPRR